MRYKVVVLIMLCLFLVPKVSTAQTAENPARWSWNCKKLSGNQYEIVFHLALFKGWHVFANTDDFGQKRKKSSSFIVPTFHFDPNGDVKLVGEVNSKGILETKKLKHVGLANIYSYKIIYVQKVSAKPGSVISGSLSYQVCDDERKKDVATERFTLTVK